MLTKTLPLNVASPSTSSVDERSTVVPCSYIVDGEQNPNKRQTTQSIVQTEMDDEKVAGPWDRNVFAAPKTYRHQQKSKYSITKIKRQTATGFFRKSEHATVTAALNVDAELTVKAFAPDVPICEHKRKKRVLMTAM